MEQITYAMSNGLRERTEADVAMFEECYSKAVSLTTLWENKDDSVKVIVWDDAFDKYLAHRAELIDYEGRSRYLPWNVYNELGLQWLNGYNFTQLSGDCCSMGHKNSFKASNLTNALRTGRTPKEIAQSITYSIARGNGTPRWGDGLNLDPMAKWALQVGNYWTDDFGKYDDGKYVKKYKKGSEQDVNALKTQSVIAYLPEAKFDYCYRATRAGLGVHIGSGVYPGASKLNKDNLAQVSQWNRGGHAVALVAAWLGNSGTPYVHLENSHYTTNYAADSLNPNKQWGCWMVENDLAQMGKQGFLYGNWYVNIGEIPVM